MSRPVRICSQKLIRNRDAPLDEFLAGSPRIVCHRYAGDDHTNEDTSAIEFLGASEHDQRLLSIDHAKVHFPIDRLTHSWKVRWRVASFVPEELGGRQRSECVAATTSSHRRGPRCPARLGPDLYLRRYPTGRRQPRRSFLESAIERFELTYSEEHLVPAGPSPDRSTHSKKTERRKIASAHDCHHAENGQRGLPLP